MKLILLVFLFFHDFTLMSTLHELDFTQNSEFPLIGHSSLGGVNTIFPVNQYFFPFQLEGNRIEMIIEQEVHCETNGCSYKVKPKSDNSSKPTYYKLKIPISGDSFASTLDKEEFQLKIERAEKVRRIQAESKSKCPTLARVLSVTEFTVRREKGERKGQAMILLLEYVEGQSLNDFMEKNKEEFINLHTWKRISFEALKGVRCMHEHLRLYHFDLKFGNIIVDGLLNVKIIGMEESVTLEEMEDPNGKDLRNTISPTIIPNNYPPPKKVRGANKDYFLLYKRIDAFQIGVMLCEMALFVTENPSIGIHPAFLQFNGEMLFHTKYKRKAYRNKQNPSLNIIDKCLKGSHEGGQREVLGKKIFNEKNRAFIIQAIEDLTGKGQEDRQIIDARNKISNIDLK